MNTTLSQGARISSRIDSKLKEKGDAIFASLGIKPSQALTMFYTQVVLQGGIPFSTKIPNTATQRALVEGRNEYAKGSLTTYTSAEDLINDALDESR